VDLSGRQQLAGDVTGDGTISAGDAGRILRMAVGDPEAFPDPLWVFDPPTLTVGPLDTSLPGQDFLGILRGDVSGSWCSSPPCGPVSRSGDPPLAAEVERDGDEIVLLVRSRSTGHRAIDFVVDAGRGSGIVSVAVPSDGMWENRIGGEHVTVAGASATPWSDPTEVEVRIVSSRPDPDLLVRDIRLDEVPAPDLPISTRDEEGETVVTSPLDLRVRPVPAAGEVELVTRGTGEGAYRLEVFDVTGRRVRDLGPFVGARAVAWDGRDDRGAAVGPGVYFARLTAITGSRNRRIVLLR
jgi:hypothetical protein